MSTKWRPNFSIDDREKCTRGTNQGQTVAIMTCSSEHDVLNCFRARLLRLGIPRRNFRITEFEKEVSFGPITRLRDVRWVRSKPDTIADTELHMTGDVRCWSPVKFGGKLWTQHLAFNEQGWAAAISRLDQEKGGFYRLQVYLEVA